MTQNKLPTGIKVQIYKCSFSSLKHPKLYYYKSLGNMQYEQDPLFSVYVVSYMNDPIDFYLIASFISDNFKFQLKIPIFVAPNIIKNVKYRRRLFYQTKQVKGYLKPLCCSVFILLPVYTDKATSIMKKPSQKWINKLYSVIIMHVIATSCVHNPLGVSNIN